MTTLRDAAQAVQEAIESAIASHGRGSLEGWELSLAWRRAGELVAAASPETPQADPPVHYAAAWDSNECVTKVEGYFTAHPSLVTCKSCQDYVWREARARRASPRESPPPDALRALREIDALIREKFGPSPTAGTVSGAILRITSRALASPPSPSDTTSPVNSPEGDTKETK